MICMYDIEGENEYRRAFDMAPIWLLQYSYYTGDILRILHALYAFWSVLPAHVMQSESYW